MIIGKAMILSRGSKVGGILYCVPPAVLTRKLLLYILPVMLKNAIQHVVDDSSFHLKVEPAATSLQQAKYVAEWSGKDENRFIFEERLVKELRAVCHLILQIRMPDLLFSFRSEITTA